MMNMKYIVYLTTCLVNSKIYVGVHQMENPNEFYSDGGYLGCGVFISRPATYKKSKTPFQYAVNKYGVKNFKRITLAVFDNPEDAYNLEKIIVSEEFIRREDTYNIKLGGEGGCPEQLKTKVYMYDLDGNFVREFNTTAECNRYFLPDAAGGGHVPRAIRLGHLFHGYQLSYEKVPFMKKFEKKKPKNQGKRIGRYDLDGNLLEIYKHTNACMAAGYHNVRQNLKGITKQCKGFVFKFIDD